MVKDKKLLYEQAGDKISETIDLLRQAGNDELCNKLSPILSEVNDRSL